MWVGAALTLAAAVTAFIGLRGTPSPVRLEEPADPRVEAERVAA